MLWTSVALLCASALPDPARAGQLLFDQGEYEAPVGQPFQVRIELDMNDSLPGPHLLQPLFSMGVRVVFPAGAAQVQGLSDLAVTPALDSNGLGGPALKESGPDYAAAAGALKAGFPVTLDPLVLTLTLLNLSATPYELRLAFFRPPPWANFHDVAGTTLDGQITTLGTATVTTPGSTVIRLTGIQPASQAATVEITFIGPDRPATAFALEATSAIEGQPWTTILDATILKTGARTYRATAPLTLTPTPQQFFRIVGTP
ncbi:MAG: hypothetical protein FJ387_02570 [Verrucomicrobia bacterium]|nr:hypothetical protein [Verrucomicrobiota bacterium]